MTAFLHSSLMVTGASGHLGRAVIERLLAAGARRLIAASRTPDRLADLSERGVELRKADFDDPGSLDTAFAGVERLLVVSTDALAVAGQRKRQHRAAVDAAVRARIRHVVYTSMPHPEPGSVIPFAPDHYETEQVLEHSGLGYTILRNNWYLESVHYWLPQVQASGLWYTAAGDGRVAYVARDDAALAAAAVLTGEARSRRYDVSGPQALSTADIAAVIQEVFGKTIQRVPVSDQQLAGGLAAAGLPPPFVELLVAMDANTRAGKVDVLSDSVERLTGRKPQSLREFLAANRAAFAGAG